jgi:hypothetical protein
MNSAMLGSFVRLSKFHFAALRMAQSGYLHGTSTIEAETISIDKVSKKMSLICRNENFNIPLPQC